MQSISSLRVKSFFIVSCIEFVKNIHVFHWVSVVFSVRKCMSPINDSGASGSGSAENLSSGSNNQTSSASRGDTSNAASNSNTTMTESFKPPTLTKLLLNRHNEDMEKLMMQKHRELRSSIKNSDKLKDSRIKTEKVNGTDQSTHYINQSHGVKRSGSHSWEGDSFKVCFIYFFYEINLFERISLNYIIMQLCMLL